MLHRHTLILALSMLVLAACEQPTPSSPAASDDDRSAVLSLPPAKSFAPRAGTPAQRSNRQIAQDFLDLSFTMESGRTLPFLTRFEEPIRVSVRPGAPAILNVELSRLLRRFRNEARIDIARAQRGQDAQIVIQAIPRRDLQRAVPAAACFVVPNVNGWEDFKRKRNRSVTDWTKLKSRTRATIILPSDVSPQEIRDCLHEEIAQALGPLNDLYRLPDSTFNDDNFHTVLTGFDMLILRAYYSPELPNGITREEAAKRLPRVLARLNPRGQQRRGAVLSPTPATWSRAISGALSPRTSSTRRATFASQAVRIAEQQGWRDNRLAFSLFVQGRATLGSSSESAVKAFIQAGEIYNSLFGNSVQTAHVATQMAAFSLSTGQANTAISIINSALPPTSASQNAALLATLLMIKAEALEFQGRTAEARKVRLDSLGWGRYGFGSEPNVRARLTEIKALVPARAKN
ncbi:MAG: DUF2927 domain-containing protein [Litoreibacter sp.]